MEKKKGGKFAIDKMLKSKKRKELIGASLLIISIIFAVPTLIYSIANRFFLFDSFINSVIPQLVVLSMAFTGFILLKDDKTLPQKEHKR